MATLYGYHLLTGNTPSRVAFTIPIFGLEIYWYGLIITAGIALGAFVVSRLAHDRALRILRETIPAPVRSRPASVLDLPQEIQSAIDKRDISNLESLLLYYGFGPDALGLNRTGYDVVGEKLRAQPSINAFWIDAPPWGVWNPYYVWSGLLWALLFALIGARLYHVLTPSPSMAEVGITSPLDYFRNPLLLVNFRRGGLGIYGGIVGGALGLAVFARRNRIPMLGWADLAVVGVALGQFVGRWGNFINQELYGGPTDVPWAVTVDRIHRLPAYADFSTFHPAFLYQSLWNLLLFFVLYTMVRRDDDKLLPGDVMATYLIGYGIGRILLELVRLDSRTFVLAGLDTGLPVATLVSAGVGLIMALWLVARHWRLRA
jgi:phosphatidylglycerol:prolipoprotein diacylglycerol transferase